MFVVECQYLQLPHARQWCQVIDPTVGELERNHLDQVILGEIAGLLSSFKADLLLHLHVTRIL